MFLFAGRLLKPHQRPTRVDLGRFRTPEIGRQGERRGWWGRGRGAAAVGVGARKGLGAVGLGSWQVGNRHSQDYRSTHGTKDDSFSCKSWEPARRKKFASDFVAALVNESSGSSVVGDVSWIHSQYMLEVLQADSRVIIVFQFRHDLEAWWTSVQKHKPKSSLCENVMLGSRGIRSQKAS
jgi:hypothetical protein